jgi:hypothetical protein
MTFLFSYHESKKSIFDELNLLSSKSSIDSIEFDDSTKFWNFDSMLFRIFSIKICKICHCCWKNSMFCQLLSFSNISTLNIEINSIFFVFREIELNTTTMLFRRWKKNCRENWKKKCNSKKICNRKIWIENKWHKIIVNSIEKKLIVFINFDDNHKISNVTTKTNFVDNSFCWINNVDWNRIIDDWQRCWFKIINYNTIHNNFCRYIDKINSIDCIDVIE